MPGTSSVIWKATRSRHARPVASYKLRKFARKHRAALATAGAFTLLMVAATAVSVSLAVWATLAEKSAGSSKPGQDREQMAIDAMKQYGDALRGTPELKNNPALDRVVARLLQEPQRFFRSLREASVPPGNNARCARPSGDG